MSLGFDKSVTAFLTGCINAFKAEQLSVEQLITLLYSKDCYGMSPLHSALRLGEERCIAAFMEAVISIDELDSESIETIAESF